MAVLSSDDEHFSDASEGHQQSRTRSPSGPTSPVPRTRVEKVDDDPSHGDVPGTHAYEKREQDAVPDEIEVVPEGCRSRSHSIAGLPDRPSTPKDSPVPQTIVEKVDPDSPSHGDIPGTPAYEQRKADAVPDFVMKMPGHGESRAPSPSLTPSPPNSADAPIPETRLTRVDTPPSEEQASGPRAHSRSPSDALPDSTETIPDPPGESGFLNSKRYLGRLTNPGSPTSLESSPEHRSHTRRRSTLTRGDNVEGSDVGLNQEPVDDFDDFAEEQEEMGEDDFGDFDDGFQGPGEVAADEELDQASMTPQQPATPPSVVSSFSTSVNLHGFVHTSSQSVILMSSTAAAPCRP